MGIQRVKALKNEDGGLYTAGDWVCILHGIKDKGYVRTSGKISYIGREYVAVILGPYERLENGGWGMPYTRIRISEIEVVVGCEKLFSTKWPEEDHHGISYSL